MAKEAGGVASAVVPAKDDRPALHVGLYGQPHVGKSWLLAVILLELARRGWPPAYVSFFDRQGKHLTYEKAWKSQGKLTTKVGVDKRETPWTDYLVDGLRIARIADYTTAVVEETDGAARLTEHFPVFEAEQKEGKWGSYVLDSLSFLSYDARKQSQYVDNATTSKGNKQNTMVHYGVATDVAEDFICSRLPNLKCNTFVVMHESKVLVEGEGVAIRSPEVPGKRLQKSNMIAAVFPELWRMYVERDAEGKKRRRLQTESDEEWQAGTVIGVPDGARATYEALWVGWEK